MPSTAHRTLLATPPPVVIVWLVAALIAGRSVTTSAANWNVQEGIMVQETYTDNVFLQPKGQAKSDLITEVAPYLRLNGEGDRLKLNFSYSPHLLLYANNPEQDGISHALSATSKAELIKNFFFFDANAQVAQNFVSPFGSTQTDLATINGNRVETYLVELSPYLQGHFGPDLSWQARNDTIWTWTSGGAFADSETVHWSAFVQTPVDLFGARTEYLRDVLDFTGQRTLESDVSRTYLYFQPNSTIRLSAIGGFERNNYASTTEETSNPIYGAGADWRPSDRTSLSGTWQERYFGSGYQVAFNHRTRLTAWNVVLSRDASSYPQTLLQLPPGNTAVLLDSLLSSRFPDPTERAAAVAEILRRTGLPPFLAAPQSIYTQQISLVESAVASFAILGVRNSLTFTGFRTSQELLSGQLAVVAGDTFATETRFTTRGISVALAHSPTALSTITGTYSLSRTVGSPIFSESTSNQYLLRWTNKLSPKTNTFLGARYVGFDTEGAGFGSYRERAVLAGFDHTF
jgi:uncharacterized protein (PEP-CTERM system associated)